jgi:hypothetical protein
MVDGAKALSEISGIPREEVLDIWAQVKANQVKLKACTKHRFEGGLVKIGQQIVCLNCGGKMGLVQAGRYVEGYEAAGGNIDDVWPGYNGQHVRKELSDG